MDANALAELRLVAEVSGLKESEIFREGIRLQAQRIRRSRALDDLMEVLESCPPEIVRFEGRA